MNKEDFFFFDAMNDDGSQFPAALRKTSIIGIIKMEDKKAAILIDKGMPFYSAKDYEDLLIDLFNQ